jgi:hypothetical protein
MTIVLPDLQWIPGAHSQRHGRGPTLIVVHRWAGGTYPGVIAEFKNPANQASAHIVYAGSVGKYANKAAQMVLGKDKAWTQYPTYNEIGFSIECADAIWLGQDPHGFDVTARMVAWLLHHYKLPNKWVRGAALVNAPFGYTRHYDLGALGGGHTDPTTNEAKWLRFCGRVDREVARGGFREVWAR